MIYAADVTRIEVQTAPGVWTDITGKTVTASGARADGDVGTFTIASVDATLDPTVSAQIRPGRTVRLLSKDGSGWRVIFTGTIRQGLAVEYHPLSRHSVRITIPATDNVAYLANAPEARGVATIDGLRWLVTGVPFIINGASTPLGAQTVVAVNDNASLWQQILTTRDSNLGYAWVDCENRLRVYDADQLDLTPAATLDTGVYSNLDVGFNDEQIINSVTVNFLRYAPVSGTTTEIPYGPYEDAASIAQWGRWSTTVTLQGLVEDEVVIAAFAQQLLARNASGAPRARSATIPIREAGDLPLTYLDLNQVVTVVHTDDTTTEQLRIAGINHEITGDRWDMTLTFAPPDAATFPSTPPSTGVSIIPEGSVGTPQIKPGAVGTTEISFVARDIGGVTTTAAPTSPTGAVAGDLWIDTDNDNLVSRWDGDEWVPAYVGTAAIAEHAIVAGKIAAGAVYAVHLDAEALTGKMIRTAIDGERLEINTSALNRSRITFYGGAAMASGYTEAPGYIEADASGTIGATETPWDLYTLIAGATVGDDTLANRPHLLLGRSGGPIGPGRYNGSHVDLHSPGRIRLNATADVLLNTPQVIASNDLVVGNLLRVDGPPGRALAGSGFDTDWQPLTLASGWVGSPQYRVKGGVLYLQGGVSRSSGSSTTMATIPDPDARPSTSNVTIRVGAGVSVAAISASGAVVISSAYSSGTAYLESIAPIPLD